MLLDKQFHAAEKLSLYLGLGSTNVQPWAREERKSVGSERFVLKLGETPR